MYRYNVELSCDLCYGTRCTYVDEVNERMCFKDVHPTLNQMTVSLWQRYGEMTGFLCES